MATAKKSAPQAEGEKQAATFRFEKAIIKKLKYMAAVDEKFPEQTQIVTTALNDFFDKWEKKNGKIPVK
jgi:hypothetical protein